jgi:hypothetical protein
MLPQRWVAARAGLVPTLAIAGVLCLGVAGVAGVTSAQGGPVLRASSSSSPSPSPSASPGVSATLTTAVVRGVTVHRGSVARVRYRADDTAGGAATLDLLITTRAGTVVRRLVTGRVTEVGVERVWRGRVRLRRGRYLLVAHAVDASGRCEANARTAELRVLAPLPPLVPTASARRAAFAWAARRAGDVAVAVVDSHGRSYGYHEQRSFITASVVKAMLLVAYLRRHDTLDPAMRATLTRMITVSDNAAADAVYRSVGRRGLVQFADRAGIRSFRASDAWILCRVAAADMARFFRDMERYIPSQHRRFANSLLAGVVSYQRWGIPAAAEPLGYRVYFKPGWLGAWVLASQAARLERRRARIGLAVFTDRNPSPTYGKETLAGITARLLRR